MKTGIITLNQNRSVAKQKYSTSVNKNINPSFKGALPEDTVSFGSAKSPELVDFVARKDFVQTVPMQVQSFKSILNEVVFNHNFTSLREIDITGNSILKEDVLLVADNIYIRAPKDVQHQSSLSGNFKTLTESFLKANLLSVEGNAELNGMVALEDGLFVSGETIIGKNAPVDAKNVTSLGPLRVNGGLIASEDLKTRSYLVTGEASDISAKRAVIKKDAVIGHKAKFSESLKIGGNLHSNARSLITAKEAEIDGNVHLFGSADIEKLVSKGDAHFSEIDKLNEILLLKSSDSEKNAHRILEFKKPLDKIQNKIKVGLGGMLELSIHTNQSVDDILQKIEFHAVTNEIKNGKQVFELGRAISPEQVAKFIEKGTIKVVKCLS